MKDILRPIGSYFFNFRISEIRVEKWLAIQVPHKTPQN